MLILKTKTALALGVPNLARALTYQLGIKLGLNPVKKITSDLSTGEFFKPFLGKSVNYNPSLQWINQHTHFGESSPNNDIPVWHLSCLTNKLANNNLSWHQTSDFKDELGDIKGVWEASRFDWAVGFAQQIKLGNCEYLSKLNDWLNDWIKNNPPYLGTNWKCGQEASIRVMHLAMAAKILGQQLNTSEVLLSLIKAHLKRISPTIMYAVAQDNNHGTSEAAALYIGGSWLVANGDKDGNYWQQQGLKWLENRAKRLIEEDGSFSQYSVTYHRVMLDTYSMAEVWRKQFLLPKFSPHLYHKLNVATLWLYNMVQPHTGDAPNLGANDGARLLPLTATDYRDFRPSVQLAACLFLNESAYVGDGEWDLSLHWLNLNKPINSIAKAESVDFEDGGYALLRNNNAFVLLNYPKFKFRPSQCDALHVDFWLDGQNILRDGGTYSYNAGQQFIDYYGGGASHNTVQFDDHEQMPRLSRFLLGDWLKIKNVTSLKVDQDKSSFSASYRDRYSCEHTRSMVLSSNKLDVVDTINHFNHKAILRWRLQPGEWRLIGKCLTHPLYKLNISSDVTIKHIQLVTGFESRYYYQQTELPVLEIEIENAGTIKTELYF